MGSSEKHPAKEARPLLVLGVVSLLLCGLFFPMIITGIGQAAFPYQANGSLVKLPDGKTVGSYYVDAVFTLPVFFHARNESNTANASASGVDPDISTSAAMAQVPRISEATGIPAAAITALVKSHEQNTLWMFGESYVNVLSLNVALMAANPGVYAAYSQ